MSVNSWGYVEDLKYKEPVEIIEGLVDVVSKNGALLLNIGPTADGRIPDEDRRILEAIGDWLRVNGKAEWERDADALEVMLPPGMRDGLLLGRSRFGWSKSREPAGGL